MARAAGNRVELQVMLARPLLAPPPEATAPCSYLVHYPGSASDLNAWLVHYLAQHPRIMRDYPGVRQIQVFTRVDWCDAMPWARMHHMQRNQLSFGSPQALLDALNSPVRARMRADAGRFPPFTGGSLHFPMHTRVLYP